MTIRYVGPGGADGNNGLTWALRKLTLNGVEDTPVVAGDIIYVGPGVYRETLTVDVSGTAGNPITYIADVTGEHTDDVGGVVRITGSDDDQTATRVSGITNVAFDYRIFRGFRIDMTSTQAIYTSGAGTNWIIEDCSICENFSRGIFVTDPGALNWSIRRCFFYLNDGNNIRIFHFTVVDSSGWLIENCFLIGTSTEDNIYLQNMGEVIIKNCFLLGGEDLIDAATVLNPGYPVLVYNCILTYSTNNALEAAALGDLIEDYNTLFANWGDRSNVSTGANSRLYPPLFITPILWDGIKFPLFFTELSEWSQIARRLDAFDDEEIYSAYFDSRYAGSFTEDDLFGIYRPTGVSLLSWGALQLREGERETTTVRTGTASIILDSAGDHQLFVPITNVSTTFEVYVYREANYEGLAPQMIIRQPDREDEVVTDTGATGAWNQLTKTLTPAADPPYVCVILRSHNEALAGNFNVFFDDLDVS